MMIMMVSKSTQKADSSPPAPQSLSSRLHSYVGFMLDYHPSPDAEYVASEHHYSNTTPPRSIDRVLGINTTRYRGSPVVIQIVVQLAISRSKFK